MKLYKWISILMLGFLGCSHTPSALKSNPYEPASLSERVNFRKVVIPLTLGTKFKISQGAFGCCTHNDPGYEYSWDFDVPYGTSVRSVEDGKVILEVDRLKRFLFYLMDCQTGSLEKGVGGGVEVEW